MKAERADIEPIAEALRVAGMQVVAVQPRALLIALPTGGYLMLGIQRTE